MDACNSKGFEMVDQHKIGNRKVTHEASSKEIDWDMLAHALAMDYINRYYGRGSNEEKKIETTD